MEIEETFLFREFYIDKVINIYIIFKLNTSRYPMPKEVDWLNYLGMYFNKFKKYNMNVSLTIYF